MLNGYLLSLKGLRWVWLALIVLVIDQISKFLLLQNFTLGYTLSLFPFLNLKYVQNYGIAFSFFSDNEGWWQRWFFSATTFGICGLLIVLMYRSKKAAEKLNNIAYSLIIGGALGNVFDRLFRGFVIDMIDFYIGDWHFATFNLSDSAICTGAALIILKGFS